MALVLLGMAAAGVLLPFSHGAAVQAEGMRLTLAARLANDLMERIVATPADQIVSGYNYTEAQGQVRDAVGTVFTDPQYAGFSRQVVCVNVRVPQESSDLPADFIRASVSVCYQGRPVATLHRLINE
jgi:hypothetical protein